MNGEDMWVEGQRVLWTPADDSCSIEPPYEA
eukprot:CAMPEP_0174744958 /NCGR_PEP_ID=MMETSP1094-20130205/85723_1 /TAXON_ID=156173 /ORGANISM="Chrysochromulina brevifilum, Strain UTEX LB 985" /LENGTH=30 /DNA_ID= /DNA_START= /DNA_END= /DNA_ORIENTATION=